MSYIGIRRPIPSSESRAFMKNSRLSQPSTSGEKSNKLNSSFQLDLSFCDSEQKFTSLPPFQRTHRSKIFDKKYENLKKTSIKKQILTKILLNRMLNVRSCLLKFKELPSKFFRRSSTLQIAKSLIQKTKINFETSLLRTLIYAEQKRISPCNQKITTTTNLFVYPSVRVESQRERKAILDLQQFLLSRTRNIVKKFEQNLQAKHYICRYFSKMIANYNHSRKIALLLMKFLPNNKTLNQKHQSRIIKNQLKLLWKWMAKKYFSKVGYSMNCLKIMYWTLKYQTQMLGKNIVTYSKIRRQDALKKWFEVIKQKKKIEDQIIVLEADKKQALTRIVQRNYIKLFKEILRRQRNLKKAAKRIALFSKISEEKAMWRLEANAGLI